MSLTHNQWNRPETNKNFMNPRRVVGDVLYNGEIDQTLLSTALYNKNPLYELPKMSVKEMGIVRKGDIVFTLIDNTSGNYPLATTYNSTGDNTTVPGISSLNGQGVFGEKNTNLMSRIMPLGIAFSENERNNETRFNIHVGGIHTVLNTGNDIINVGDWVMAYAPTPAEAASGGRGKIADKNNLVTLWFKPYDPKIHRMSSPKQIHNFLTDQYNKKDTIYLPSYKAACNQLIDSTQDIGLLFVSRHFDAIRETELDKEDFLRKLMMTEGHSEYVDKISPKSGKPEALKRRQEWINMLMVPHSGKADAFKDKDLLRNQMDAISEFIDCVAYFYHDVAKNVLWKAVSSARPKENFEVHCAAYMS